MFFVKLIYEFHKMCAVAAIEKATVIFVSMSG